jgi:hypothetical protein
MPQVHDLRRHQRLLLSPALVWFLIGLAQAADPLSWCVGACLRPIDASVPPGPVHSDEQTCELLFAISPTGSVTPLRVVDGCPGPWAETIGRAASSWRFEPKIVDGEPEGSIAGWRIRVAPDGSTSGAPAALFDPTAAPLRWPAVPPEQRCPAVFEVNLASGIPDQVDLSGCPASVADSIRPQLADWRWRRLAWEGGPTHAPYRLELVSAPAGSAGGAVASPTDALPALSASAVRVRRQVAPDWSKVPVKIGPAGVTCRVTMVVGPDGRPQSVDVSDCPEPLAPATEAAMMRWRFAPHRIDGTPVAFRLVLPVRFAPPDPS